MRRFTHLAQRIFNTPHAMLPGKAEIIARAIGPRLGVHALNGVPLAFDGGDDFAADDLDETNGRGYDNVGGIAVIPVRGTLVQKLGTLRPVSGMTGYDGIQANFFNALADPAIEAIVFDVDSPGGEVAGVFDLVDAIFAARGDKPIWAILAESAYSAAYALASAADTVTVPRTGGTGSIGVIALHADFSGALKQAGIDVTLIQYGARKADSAETAPLSSEARRRLQADINALGAIFDATVARNRKIPLAKVKSFEVATFMGAAGVAAGLADAVMAPHAAFADLCRRLEDASSPRRAPQSRSRRPLRVAGR